MRIWCIKISNVLVLHYFISVNGIEFIKGDHQSILPQMAYDIAVLSQIS
jgi:hypothetical protein